MTLASFCNNGPAAEDLSKFGWNLFFHARFEDEIQRLATSHKAGSRSRETRPRHCPARVASDYGESYRLITEHCELKGGLAGRLRHLAQGKSDLPAVGDWVVIDPVLDEQKGIIQGVLPRRSRFVRKEAGARSREQILAANIDTVFVVVALNNDFNLRRIERYLAAIWDSGADPVLVLNKSDLCADSRRHVAASSSVARGVPVHPMSALSGEGVAELDHYLARGQTVALVGSSGAGKSTLINRLFGSAIRLTHEIRASDDRGKHATSTRDLILLPTGALVLDTPGMRELQLWDADQSLEQTFHDIDALAAQCRFRDCSHKSEPGCAVKEALDSGRVDPGRIENFEKLRKEAEFLELRRRYGAKRAEKERWKKGIEMMRKRQEPG